VGGGAGSFLSLSFLQAMNSAVMLQINKRRFNVLPVNTCVLLIASVDAGPVVVVLAFMAIFLLWLSDSEVRRNVVKGMSQRP
jgi:hypothetical protein